ncbi:MAG: response regulator, partial [Bacteroidota bacterium]
DVIDYGVIAGTSGQTAMVYFIMEFLKGNSLAQVILNESPVPPERALAIARELRDTAFMISELTAIGISYDGTPQVDKEFEYAEKAISLLRPNSSLKSRLNAVRLLGIYLQNKGDRERSLPLSMYSIELSKALGDKDLTQNLYEQVADVFSTKGDHDQALAMMDSAAAYSSFKRELSYFYRGYAEIAAAKGDQQLALDYYRKAFEEQIKGYTDRNAALLTEMETRLRTRETEILLTQQKRQRWLWIGLTAALAALLGGAVFAFFRQKKGKQKMAEQKQLIEKQADELRRLDEMKSRFFANVSHELRTPLTLMLAPIGSALKHNRLENQDFTLLKLAQTHGKALLKLVNQILDLSKVQAGKLELQEAPVTLFPFLRRIAAAFESHAERQGIRFSFQYKAERGLQVELDAPKFETILNNLLSNALKFTPAGQSVNVLLEDFDHSLRLVVSDTGRGIHPADLPHIFDRFYQSNQPGAPTEGGTGIGLAFCRELVELMQGKIWAESDPERGSRFFVETPRKEILGAAPVEEPEDDFVPVENEMVSPMSVALPADAPTVLVVEDNSSLRDYLRLILSKTCHVQTAEHGQAALDILAQNANYQLVISDIMMPVMDGFQLLENLKSDDRLRHLPVVMLTARAEVQDKLRALRIGVDDYLLKPFEEEELLARVENLLKNYKERQGTAAAGVQLSESLAATPPLPTISKEDQAWLEDLENQVKIKLGDTHLTSDTLADALAMSRAQFFRQVKKLTGLTPAQYLDEARFRQARSLLELGKARSVKAVAFEVGFRQVEHFSRQFKDRFGKYPSAYLDGN